MYFGCGIRSVSTKQQERIVVMILFLGIFGAAIGAVVAEYTVGWVDRFYMGFGMPDHIEFHAECFIFVGVGLLIGLLIGLFVKKLLSSIKESKNVQQTSSADEISKFKTLLESGIITQEEFDAKKKELLNL